MRYGKITNKKNWATLVAFSRKKFNCKKKTDNYWIKMS